MPDTDAPRGTLLFSAPALNPYGLADAGSYSKPSLGDIDADGDLDLLVGNASGDTLFFLNEGSATLPSFATAVAHPFGLGTVDSIASPSFADIDGDGDLDVFIGDGVGDIHFFLNTGTATLPEFAAPEVNPYGLSNVGFWANAQFADIDGDGDLDAIVGSQSGETQVFENTGTATSPLFAPPQLSPMGLTDVGIDASPSMADIDGDGDLDLFIGRYEGGDTLLYVNGGNSSSPQFEAPLQNPWGLAPVLSVAVPAVGDIDGDGDPDVLLGAFDGNIRVFLNTGAFVAPVGSNTPDGIHGVGSVIRLTVTFSEDVTVDGGVPTLVLETGATDREAVYVEGSGTSTLVFAYTVQEGDASADLDIASASALSLNGANLRDAAGNDAVLTLATPGASGSLSANAGLVVDGSRPTATVAAATIQNTASATVQSSQTGTAYLVSTSVAVTDLGSITSAPDDQWNSVPITAADTDTVLAAMGLAEGSYKLYTANELGNLSIPSAGSITIDDTAPLPTGIVATPASAPFGLVHAGAYVKPSLADIDADGDLDLLVGNGSGDTLFFRNEGSATQPAFGPAILHAFGLGAVGSIASPSFADIDGDGDFDVFIGNGQGDTRFYQNTGTATEPAFAAPVVNPYGLSDVGLWANAQFVDIDGDSDLDALVGNQSGETWLFANTGSPTSPAFAAPQVHPLGLGDVGYDASPNFVDIDGDGDLDAFIGRYQGGDTLLYVNTGTSTAAQFADPVVNPWGLTSVGVVAAPAIGDINGDGAPDALIGAGDGTIKVFLNTDGTFAPVDSVDGSFGVGSAIMLAVSLSEPVFVTGGTPTLSLQTGSTVRYATYTGGSGTSTLQFRYVVQAGDTSSDPDLGSPYSIALHGATIRDVAGNDAELPGTPPDTTSPTATLTPAALRETGSATVQSSEAGTAYLVNALLDVSGLATITAASDADWNSVPVPDPGKTVELAVSGLRDGTYKLYTTDASGNLSAASSGSVTIDNEAPHGTLPVPPAFSTPGTNPYGLANVGQIAAPTLVDIDNDGDLDVFAGESTGSLLYFQNHGSASSPSFDGFVNVPFGLVPDFRFAKLSFGDIDGDGDFDAVHGGIDGNVRVFLNTGSATSPAFAAPVVNPYGLSGTGFTSNPTLADIDGDGDLDVFVGDFDGNTLFLRNDGDATNPDFAAAQSNPFGLASVSILASPRFADVDGDGDLDAFIGNGQGDTYFFQNTGTAASASFLAPVTNAFGLADVGSSANPSFADIDGDGDLDALIGNKAGDTLVFLRQPAMVAAVDSKTPDGVHGVGSTITLNVTFSETVIVDTASGSPTLLLETGAIDRSAVFTRGSGTTTLSFTYTVQPGDASADLDIASASALALNGATIRDAAGNDAALLLVAPGATGSLAARSALVIDTTGPTSGPDLLQGTSGNDTLQGLAGNDTLLGFEGDDLLRGGAGADSMAGGSGNDRYTVASAGDIVDESVEGGTDLVFSRIAAYTLPAEIENGRILSTKGASMVGNALANVLFGGMGADTLAGGAGNDRLGGSAGNDSLDGGSGNDILRGDQGEDAMRGGDGNDIYVVDNAGDTVIETAALAGIDLVIASIGTFTLGAHVENLRSTCVDGALLTGNALGNAIWGGPGNDTVSGEGGNDRLNGGSGADTFVFGNSSGRDALFGFSLAEGDRIQVPSSLNGLSFASAGALLARTTDTVAGAVVDLGSGNIIRLVGVSVHDIDASAFVIL